MTTPKRKRASAAGAGPSQLAESKVGVLPQYTKAETPSTISQFQGERVARRRFAAVRLKEIYTLGIFRRRAGFIVDGNRFASALAFTLACDCPGRVFATGKAEGRGRSRAVPWVGLSLESLRRATVSAELGEFEDAELFTIIADVERWRAEHGPRLATAKRLGLDLALTAMERDACSIRTIEAVDESKAERQARLHAAKLVRDRERQRTLKVRKPRALYEAESLSQTQPWKAFGISRRQWERRGKPDVASLSLTIDDLRARDLRHDAPASGRVERAAGGTEFPEPGSEIIERSEIGSYGSEQSSARSRGLGVSRMSKREAQMVTFDPSAAIAALLEAEAVLSERAETHKLAASIGLFRLQLEIEAETQPEDGADTLRIGIEHLVPRLRAANDNRLSSILRRLAA